MAHEAGGSEDELDALLSSYDAQAKRDIASSQAKAAGRPAKRTRGSAAERRDEALAQPLPETNKGFQLLARMGYQPGQGVGAAATGRAEPVAVDVKQDRLGLGAVNKSAARRDAQREREAGAEARRGQAQLRDEARREGEAQSYQQRTASQFAARKVEGQLRRALAACEALDLGAGIADSAMWGASLEQHLPAEGAADEAADEAADDEALRARREAWAALASADKLARAAEYLRSRHLYCIHCAAQYGGEEELAAHCPGPGEDDH
jgi:hypothetical protein